MVQATEASNALSFGPYRLALGERRLSRDDRVVDLGDRALDILIALASRPNQVVRKRDLLAAVWPDVVVEEGSLRFHIANLRKALGDEAEDSRYIATVTGRGYRFVAAIAAIERNVPATRVTTGDLPIPGIPNRPLRVLGRDADLAALHEQQLARRFITLVGSGGVGKTTVALEMAHRLAPQFSNMVMFVDLGMLSDPGLVVTAVASMLGLSVQSADPTPALLAYLRDKRMLLMLDTCEHLIDAAATLAAHLFKDAPLVYILATSREPLQVDGEHIYRLAPLGCPPTGVAASKQALQSFPATQLFLDRAIASGASWDPSDADAGVVIDICRRLDGMPLAIELAARRVEAYGLKQILALLDHSLALAWVGARDAPARQKTLFATLRWSYSLLSQIERDILCRLAVFVGNFTLDAALEVVTDEKIDPAAVFTVIDSLVAKSVIATRPIGATMRYRLLDTTRAYVAEMNADDESWNEVARRHASYCVRWLGHFDTASVMSRNGERGEYLPALNNVRVALEWAFGPTGDPTIAIELATTAARIFLAMSLLPECIRWSAKALEVLDNTMRDSRNEMLLQAALGVSLMFSFGGRQDALLALQKSVAIAARLGDRLEELQVLGAIKMFHSRTGEFNQALRDAERCEEISATLNDPLAITIGKSLLGTSLHLAGEHSKAREQLEAALRSTPGALRTTAVYIGFEFASLAGVVLARTLWLQGHTEQALDQARRTVNSARGSHHYLNLCVALIWATTVFLWADELDEAENHIAELMSCAETHSLKSYATLARAFGAELARRKGDFGGIATLKACLRDLHAAPYELYTTAINISLIETQAATGNVLEASSLLEQTLHAVEENGDTCYLPELFRLRAQLSLLQSPADLGIAEENFKRSLEISESQGARNWLLQTALEFAAFLLAHRDKRRAREYLSDLRHRFAASSEAMAAIAKANIEV